MKNLLGIPTLFLIDCPEDDSLTLVEQGDVLCDPSVKEGDIISFFYKRKEPYIGKVVAMGGKCCTSLTYSEVRTKLVCVPSLDCCALLHAIVEVNFYSPCCS